MLAVIGNIRCKRVRKSCGKMSRRYSAVDGFFIGSFGE